MRAPQTHDWEKRGFGNDYIWKPSDNGLSGSLVGWRENIAENDLIILYQGDCKGTYRVASIQYEKAPRDMFSANLAYVGAQ